MMQTKKVKKGILILFLLIQIGLYAQETMLSAGGEAYGSGGYVSYSIGQVMVNTNTGINDYESQEGVQQPYEISEVVSLPEAKEIMLSISLFPNPTTSYLLNQNTSFHKIYNIKLTIVMGRFCTLQKHLKVRNSSISVYSQQEYIL